MFDQALQRFQSDEPDCLDLFYFFRPKQKVNIRATPWQTFKGDSSDSDVNQWSLCEHITRQKLAFCNTPSSPSSVTHTQPLKPSLAKQKGGREMPF